MKILFVYNNLFIENSGGVQNITLALGNSFKEQGHDVDFLSVVNDTSHIESNYKLPFLIFSGSKEKCLQNFKECIFKSKPDIVINQTFGHTLINYLLDSLDKKIDVYSVIHTSLLNGLANAGIVYENKLPKVLRTRTICSLLNSNFAFKILRRAYKAHNIKRLKATYSLSKYTIILSEGLRDELQYLLEDSSKVRVISNFNVRDSSERINLEEKNDMVLYISRLDKFIKRSDLLMKLFIDLAINNDNVDFIISGQGPYKDTVVQCIETLALNNLRYVEENNVENLLSMASIFCSTSASESFGLSILESMSFGCVPVIFNSYPEAINMIDHTVNGILVEGFDLRYFRQMVQDLINNKSYRDSLAGNAIMASSASYKREEVIKRWIELFTTNTTT